MSRRRTSWPTCWTACRRRHRRCSYSQRTSGTWTPYTSSCWCRCVGGLVKGGGSQGRNCFRSVVLHGGVVGGDVLCRAVQGVDVVAAHGDKDQQERLDAVRDFKTGVVLAQLEAPAGQHVPQPAAKGFQVCQVARTQLLVVSGRQCWVPHCLCCVCPPLQASRMCWLPQTLPARASTSLACST